MNIRITYFFLYMGIAFTLSFCKNKKHTDSDQEVTHVQDKSIKIFRSTEKVNLFVLRINDDFYYRDTSDKKYSKPWELIKEYIPTGDTIGVYVKIDNKDTSFVYNVLGIDSILFGRMQDYGFYIRSNLHKRAWLFN